MTTINITTQKVGQFTIYGIENLEVHRTRYHNNGDFMLYALTPCCNATGKGMEYETGVGCRSCYEEVDSLFGFCWTEDEFKQGIDEGMIEREETR